ncbi:hypothetical protein [Sulfitobacter sp. R18_1]|uniref:hypothetical protein n=1 Tax=Sulfitobacter sp. R18_1 TaxID=2821104 RepID=UPI001ADCAB88|nr:hypothetical protein [Sulfitobacter sp. R18_1]MBO9428812.1 hypothetical protein [Sulfitobacter sp. R18_1]
MTDFIADILFSMGQSPLPRKTDGVDPDELAYLQEMRQYSERLKGRELYSFDASAMRAAADLRVDTPERVERLVAAVFSEPRQLFFEVDVSDRDSAMAELRGFFGHLQSDRTPAQRFGVFVDVLGEGRATIQPIWLHSRYTVRDHPALGQHIAGHRSYPVSVRSALSAAYRLAPSPLIGTMDVSKHVGISKAEFEFVLGKVKAGYDPLLDRAQREIKATEGVRATNQARDRFWRMMRFRDITKVVPSPDYQDSEISSMVRSIYPREMLDPLEEGLHVVAMMALLEVDTGDIAKEPRRRSSGGRKGMPKGKSASKGDMAPGVSVVTLNIEDRGLQRFYETGSAGSFGGGGDSSARARHPVRGHLFLARNGKITWRKAHWRGSLEKSTLKRVVAPSYTSE